MGGTRRLAPNVTNLAAGLSDDRRSIILKIDTAQERFACALSWSDVPKLIAVLLRLLAGASAKLPAAVFREGDPIQPAPIKAWQLGAQAAATPDELTVVANVGVTTLGLVVEKPMLRAFAANLEPMMLLGGPETKTN
jgi:hypothetical protein